MLVLIMIHMITTIRLNSQLLLPIYELEDIVLDDVVPVMHVTEINNATTNNERHIVVNEPENSNNIQHPIVTVPNVDETPTDNTAEKIVNNSTNEILKETNAATVTDLEQQNEDDVAMVTAPERQ
ncbi:hypothetical protein A2U01_0014552 [Trifolium medium]|uniref:Uncharacterized protein n=1 Tax=Trifolium medium TaxID=97028 RepID=A0A392N1D0_9FABA|nr:hypothetical protein [Trifolium medium]